MDDDEAWEAALAAEDADDEFTEAMLDLWGGEKEGSVFVENRKSAERQLTGHSRRC